MVSTPRGQWNVVKFPSADTGSGKGENGVYTHSVGWDNSATNHGTGMARHSLESSAQVPRIGRPAVDPSLRLRVPFFTFLGQEGNASGVDMGQADVSMRLHSTIKQRAIDHWVTWFLTGSLGHHQALAMRGRCRMGIASNLMA